MGVWYTTREAVMSAQDIKKAAYSWRDIDSAIESASRAAEALLHRHTFAPTVATRYFDWPSQSVFAGRLYLDQHPLISVTALATGGVAVDSGDFFLEPINEGPPYHRIELDLGGPAYWQGGATRQRNIAVTGLWGWSDNTTAVGVTAEALDGSETGVDGSGMPGVGVGSIIKVDSERMIVTDKSWLTTGQTTSAAASQNAQTLTVADGSAFVVGEVLLVGAERVLVVDIAGNSLVVRRAWDGSTLAAHSGDTVYALRTLTVQRGALGTTPASHVTASPVVRWDPPALLAELTLAYALNNLLQRESGYARTVGEGENEREATGRGIAAIEADARSALGRMARTAVV